MRRRFICFVGVFLFVQALICARGVREADLSPGSAVPRDPKLISGVLDNGIQYYIRRNVRPENRAELRLVMNAGSILEDEDQLGLAHLVEHMAFQGTRNFEQHRMIGWLESIGMRFGPDTNAYTSFDETVYQLTVPTGDARIMDTALSILEDWMQGMTLSGDAMKKERGVVLEEWRLRRGVYSRLQDTQLPVLLSGSRYAQRLPIGTPRTIMDSPDEALRRFYRDWYRPDLAAIVAVGDFNPDAVERMVRERFSRVEWKGDARRRGEYPVPAHAQTLVSSVSDPELGQTSVTIYAKKEAKNPRDIGEYRERFVESIFFAMMNERFQELSLRPDSPFLGAETGSFRFVRPVHAWYVLAAVEEGQAAQGAASLIREMKRAALHGFSDVEIRRAKADTLRSYEQTWEEAEHIESEDLTSMYVRNYLEGGPVLGPEYAWAVARRLVPDIGAEEIADVANVFLGEENRVVLLSGPSSAGLPREEEILAVLAAASAEEPLALSVEETPDGLLEDLPVPGTAVRVHTAQAREAGLTEWTLGNGARVVLKTTDFKNDELLMTAFSPGGTSLYSDEDFLTASFAENVVQQSGAGLLSLVQLQKFLSGKQIMVTPRIYGQNEGMRGSASVKDIESFFQLIYAYVTAPRYDGPAVEVYLRQLKNNLRDEEKQPDSIFFNKVREILTGGHPRGRPVRADMIDSIDTRRAFELYKDRFSDVSDFTFIFVGSISSAELEPYLCTYLASLPGKGRKESWRDTGLRFSRGKAERTVRAGLEERSMQALVFTGDFDWSREEVFRTQVLEDYLDLRLREILREDKGGTYGVSVGMDVYRYPVGEYTLGIYFGASPENVDGLSQAAVKALEEMKESLPLESDAAKLREQYMRQHERRIRENSFWLESLRFNLLNGLPADIAAWRPQQIGAITPRLIQNLIRAYCNGDNLAQIRLLPAGEEAAEE
ncbi:MAG: insulinase family protein [Spirochaetales bacterium]|nr:insulinase family protein [Spirochaetales bacterium]